MKKFIAILLVMVLAVSVFAGCGNVTNDVETTLGTSQPDVAPTEGDTTVAEFSYPVADGGTITWWMSLNPNWSGVHANLGDTEFAKALEKQTGITVEYQHPAADQYDADFSFMVAEGKFPDLLEYNFTNYAGGPDQAIEDGIIISLNDVIDQYCPNLKAFLEANPDVDKLCKTDNGTYYTFPHILGDEELGVTQGLFIRGDWLEKYDLEVPETIDDWHNVLTVFKENGVESPFCLNWSSLRSSPFMYAFGVGAQTYYLDDEGNIHYGVAEDGYKEFLKTMKQWYDEGLLDVDMAALKNDQITAKMTSGAAGASCGWAASRMQAYVLTGQQTDPNYTLVACPVPVLNEGDKPVYGVASARYSGNGVSITTDCENVELAARLLDYAYSEEGALLYNYGTEGVSYEMIEGVATYTDLITANPDGNPIGQMVAEYARANYTGPYVQELNYYTQYLQVDTVKAAPEIWYVEGALDHVYPKVTQTTEETDEANALATGVSTYYNEQILSFVMGEQSFDNWDKFVKDLYDTYGIERVLEIKAQALERFNAR